MRWIETAPLELTKIANDFGHLDYLLVFYLTLFCTFLCFTEDYGTLEKRNDSIIIIEKKATVTFCLLLWKQVLKRVFCSFLAASLLAALFKIYFFAFFGSLVVHQAAVQLNSQCGGAASVAFSF